MESVTGSSLISSRLVFKSEIIHPAKFYSSIFPKFMSRFLFFAYKSIVLDF